MEETTPRSGNREGTDYTKVLLSASVSTLAWLFSLIAILCGLVGRLWLNSLESDLSAIRTTASAETNTRIEETRALRADVNRLDNGQIEAREQRRQVIEQLRDLRQKVDRYQEDGHGRRR